MGLSVDGHEPKSGNKPTVWPTVETAWSPPPSPPSPNESPQVFTVKSPVESPVAGAPKQNSLFGSDGGLPQGQEPIEMFSDNKDEPPVPDAQSRNTGTQGSMEKPDHNCGSSVNTQERINKMVNGLQQFIDKSREQLANGMYDFDNFSAATFSIAKPAVPKATLSPHGHYIHTLGVGARGITDEQRALVYSEVDEELSVEDVMALALGSRHLSSCPELKIAAAIAHQAGIGTIGGMIIRAGVDFDARAFYHAYADGMPPNMRRLLFITATLPENIVWAYHITREGWAETEDGVDRVIARGITSAVRAFQERPEDPFFDGIPTESNEEENVPASTGMTSEQ